MENFATPHFTQLSCLNGDDVKRLSIDREEFHLISTTATVDVYDSADVAHLQSMVRKVNSENRSFMFANHQVTS